MNNWGEKRKHYAIPDFFVDFFQDVLLRSLTLGLLCGYDYPACRDRAVEDFLTWRESPFPDLPRANPIDAEVKDSAYCTAIRNGDSV